ncbi:acylphosphatase [Naasia lichenicola]|uniref:acylphosphatase n=1 Tax=Naasia lichenicola TaxID=2565933 RepID=A0A4S4FS81_9MICO|nr:acylphosphatase [Naasia lichenicola]THG33148.1 acylphosphatase [Naasia lichenicola]
MDIVTDPLIARRVWISGTVQGVGFRYWTEKEAIRLGVGGTVRNLFDQRVEAEFEGPPEAVDSLTEWLRHGPPSARVSGIEVEEREPRGMTRFSAQ